MTAPYGEDGFNYPPINTQTDQGAFDEAVFMGWVSLPPEITDEDES